VNEEDKAAPSAEADHSQALESFRSLCGDADCNALRGLLEKVSGEGGGDVSPVILSPDADKAHRSVSSPGGYWLSVPWCCRVGRGWFDICVVWL
jgi:hypothetical protein